MNLPVLRLAVVGHTNTGKTSLLRTLTRNVEFGEVSPRPATTRQVEGTAILLGGAVVMELYDTPGLEDSIGLLDHLDGLAGKRRADGLEVLRQFLDSRAAKKRFGQEAKALRQVLACDMALYVIDARDRVLGKHRDELEILARCATPVVPVLNFTADSQARVSLWRDQLARTNMHAVAEFDTVALDEMSEQRLFEKMKILLDSHAATLDALIEERRELRATLMRASADLTADLLLDAAAVVIPVPVDDEPALEKGLDRLRQLVRDREQRSVEQLLALHQFRNEDYDRGDTPLVNGQWGLDLFSPQAVKQFGLKAGSAAAAGALVGLMLDAMVGGISGGAMTVAGATVGGLLGAGRTHGRRLLDRARGTTELRCDDNTLRLLALRQIMLTRSLLRRGHAAVTPIAAPSPTGLAETLQRSLKRLPSSLDRARTRPTWTKLGNSAATRPAGAGRAAAQADLSRAILKVLQRPAEQPLMFP